MRSKISRLFVIKTRWEAYAIIFGLALGAVERGSAYLSQYPGSYGQILFLASTAVVFMAGAKILDCLRYEREHEPVLESTVKRAPSPSDVGVRQTKQ